MASDADSQKVKLVSSDNVEIETGRSCSITHFPQVMLIITIERKVAERSMLIKSKHTDT